jgi:hypothetical protein
MKIKLSKPNLSTLLIIAGMVIVLSWYFYNVATSPKTDSGESNYKAEKK